MNGAAFFSHVRETLFGGRLAQSQVDGINVLLTAWREHSDTWDDPAKLAYMLATALHETAKTMQPIAEYGLGAGHPYGVIDATGKAPYGRGYVQLTWRTNYIKADKKLELGGRLMRDYDLALYPPIASQIIVRGMMEGWFTGRRLSTFINAERTNFIGARKIINGTDRAVLIAGYAQEFLAALKT